MVVGLVFACIGIYKAVNRQAVPVAEAPAPAAKMEVSASEIEKIRREAEERVRREYADKSAAEQAAAAKAASDKAVQAAQEKAAAARLAAEKQAADKAFAEKLAAAKSAGERAALEKQAADRAAAEKVAAEKAAAEKAAAEKLAAEKAAAEKAAAEKIAAAKPAGQSHEELLERFVQRHGRDKVVAVEPPNVPAAMRRGEIAYVNDGSCGPGRIKEVMNMSDGWSASFTLRPREYRCISLRDGTAAGAPAAPRAPEKAAAESVAAAAPRPPNRSTPQIAAALDQFMARHPGVVLDREPGSGHISQFQVVYVNDGSCPEGEIREVTGGNLLRGVERARRCIKLQ
jgi:hypothetical protein